MEKENKNKDFKLQSQLVSFNKLSSIEDDADRSIYGFDLEFFKLYEPNDKKIDVSIDFASNEDIDFLISLLNELKEK